MKISMIPAATFVAMAALVAFVAPIYAFAAPVTDDVIVEATVVTTADLNLANEEGRSALKTRIASAVNRVCGASNGTISLEERLAMNACRAKARNAALAAAKSRGDQVLAQR